MKTLTRRSAVLLSVAAPTTGMAFPMGGEIDSAMVGINIRIAWIANEWQVFLPDWDAAVDREWKPGHLVPSKWVSLTSYLREIEQEYKLVESIA